jgi:hypothetical protein
MFKRLYESARDSKKTDYAIYAPVVEDKGRGEVYYGGGFHFIGKTYTGRTAFSTGETEMIASTAPLIDMDKVPGGLLFDEEFFIYWNDADFFYRMRAVGLKIMLVDNAFVKHYGGTKDYSHRQGTSYSSVRAFYVLRNQRLFILKNYQLSTIFIFLPCFILYELFNMGFCLRKRIFIKGYLRSLSETLKELYPLFLKRRSFQKRRRVPDRDLLGCFPLDYNPGVVSSGAERFIVSILENILYFYYRSVRAIFWRDI